MAQTEASECPSQPKRLLRKSTFGSQKERERTCMLSSSPSKRGALPSQSFKERGGDAGGGEDSGSHIQRGDSLPGPRCMSSLDSRRLDRQKAQMWAWERDSDCDNSATVTMTSSGSSEFSAGSPDGSFSHSHGYTNLCQGTSAHLARVSNSDEVDPDSLAYHLELLGDLPEIMAKLKGSDITDIREAAEEVRELSRSTLPVLQQAVTAGIIPLLPPLLKHEDSAVVEPIVLTITSLAQKDAKFARRLADEGVMALLSTVFIRAGEERPRPHTSLQGNIAAAYLALFAGLGTTRAGAMLTGQRIIQTLIQLAGPLSGKNYQGRRDALKLLVLLLDRPDVHTQLVSLGGAEALIETVESGDDEIMEEVADLILLVAKSREGIRRLCKVPATMPQTPDKTEGRSAGNNPLGESGEGESDDEDHGGEGGRGVAALVKLLSPEYSPKTQESAASVVMRILTRGMSDCARVVRESQGLKPALDRLLIEGAPKPRRQAAAILEALDIGH